MAQSVSIDEVDRDLASKASVSLDEVEQSLAKSQPVSLDEVEQQFQQRTDSPANPEPGAAANSAIPLASHAPGQPNSPANAQPPPEKSLLTQGLDTANAIVGAPGDAISGFIEGLYSTFRENPPTGVSPEDKKKLRDLGVFAADSDLNLWNIGPHVLEAAADTATVVGDTAMRLLEGATVRGPAKALANVSKDFGLNDTEAGQLEDEAKGFFFLAGLATLSNPEGAAAAESRATLNRHLDKTLNRVIQKTGQTKAEDMRAQLRAQAQAELDKMEIEAANRRFQQPTASQITAKSRFDWKARRIVEQVDAKRSFKILDQQAAKNKGVPRSQRDLSTYISARTTAGVQAVMDGAHKFGAPKVVRETVTRGGRTVTKQGLVFEGKGLNDVLAPIANQVEEFNLYAAARRQKSLALQIAGGERAPINLEFTGPQMRNALLLGKINPKFKAVFRDYRKFNRQVLDFAEANGVLSAEQKANFIRLGENYVPYYRLVERDGKIGVKGNPLKALKGGKEPLNDIVNNMARNTNMWIHAAVQNRAKLDIYDLIKKEGWDGLATPLKPEAQIRFGKPVDAEIRSTLEEAGLTANDELIKVLTFNRQLADNVDVVYRNGERVMYEIHDPVMLKGIHDFSPKPLAAVTRMLGMPPAEALKAGTTKYNPIFGIVNFGRDSLSAVMNSRAGFIPVWDSMAGFWSTVTENQFYRDFLANGGGFSTFTTAPMSQNLARMYTRGGIKPGNVLTSPMAIAKWTAKFNQVLEEANRVGEFRRSRLKGMGRQEAAFNARSVSTDFAIHGAGDFTRNFMATVPFLNARLQGLDEMGRALGRNPGRVALTGLTLVTMPSLALRYLNHRNPNFDQLPDYVKDMHWVIPDPTGPRDKDGWAKDFVLVPKPFEWGAIFGTIPENMFDLSKTGNWGRFGRALNRMVFDTFSVAPPQIVRPLLESKTFGWNRTFGDRPVVPSSLEDVLTSEQFNTRTGDTLKELGLAYKEATGTEPPLGAQEVKHLVRGYFGSLAAYGLWVSDQVVRAAKGETRPEFRLDEVPLGDRIFEQNPTFASQYQTEFYDLATRSRQVVETVRKMTRMGREPDLTKRQRMLMALYPQVTRFQRLVSGAKLNMERVWTDKDLSPAEKRRKVNGIQVQVNEGLRQFMKGLPEDFTRSEGLKRPQ